MTLPMFICLRLSFFSKNQVTPFEYLLRLRNINMHISA